MAYAHEFGGAQELQTEYNQFFQALREQNLASRCVFLLGNHDSSLKAQPSAHEFVVTEYAWLFCQTFRVLIHHGHCTGYERMASAYGRSAEALRRLRARLESDKTGWLPPLGDKDWMITGHFDIPVRDLPRRVVGLGSWVGDLTRSNRGYYALIHPEARDAPVVLRKYRSKHGQ